MLNKILLATENPHKQEKLNWMVKVFFDQIDLPKKPQKISEVGKTFEEIASKKAIVYGKGFDGFTIATDGGMEIPALGNSWNALFTKRFNEGTDFDRMDALLELMEGKEDRRMSWREAVAIAYKNKIVFSTTVEGAKGILQTYYDKKKYKKGIWLCSLWYFPTYKKNYFDLKPRQVDFAEVSWHRIKREVEKFFSVPYSLRLDQREVLKKIRLALAFTLENWPHDPLMENIKNKSMPIIDRALAGVNFFGDDRDLKYQVLFRLTTFRADELFNEKFRNYLEVRGIYKNWRNILNLDKKYLSKFKINEGLVKKVIKEQIRVTRLRQKNMKPPLKKILDLKNGMFKGGNYVIEKSNGSIFAVGNNKKIELEFKPVSKIYARELHNKLHYIHCARVEKAFGLFIKGKKIPFSVLAVEKIDREYKKTAVLLKGYDYNKVVDFTRLYSVPNSPMNTSSVMFALARNYLRKNTDIQACLSAFMPSYANGMSMFAGGLDTVLVAKPLKHTFVQIPGTNLFKHVVKRAQEDLKGRFVESNIPLLPTLELLSPITGPPLKPNEELNGKMIDLT